MRKIRFRYSIHAALVLVLVAAAYFAHLSREETVRLEFIASVERAGGSVSESSDASFTIFPSLRIESISIPLAEIRSISTRDIAKFPNLAEVVITEFRIEHKSGVTFEAVGGEVSVSAREVEFLEHLGANPSTVTIDDIPFE